MSTDFATLNADLLHLCLAHLHESGKDVARAGATCKHWRAVASTNRLWRELCIKRWPSTAKLPRALGGHLAFYQMRSPAPVHRTPLMDINRVSLLIDGHASGGHNFSEVLSFANAVKSAADMNGMEFELFEWDVPAILEFAPKYYENIRNNRDASHEGLDVGFGLQFLRDDGKVAREKYFNDWGEWAERESNSSIFHVSRPLDLEARPEQVTREREEYYYITLEAFPDGKVRAFFSWRNSDDDAHEEHRPRHPNFVAALLDWGPEA